MFDVFQGLLSLCYLLIMVWLIREFWQNNSCFSTFLLVLILLKKIETILLILEIRDGQGIRSQKKAEEIFQGWGYFVASQGKSITETDLMEYFGLYPLDHSCFGFSLEKSNQFLQQIVLSMFTSILFLSNNQEWPSFSAPEEGGLGGRFP